MKNLNSWRIEYIRTKSIRVPFTPKAFFCFSPVRCAGLSHDDRLRCHGLPRSWVVTTVFRVMKSLVRAMKTVVMEKDRQINEKSVVLPIEEECLTLIHPNVKKYFIYNKASEIGKYAYRFARK